ncbi:uncharacterized protein Bfra_002148 [Botrytis fragariae]|uniref:Uncharacterized protein n=1 Tax=Botrytis fragariae TaxID=1964551 RepID=A0A8H6B1P1_9HELO|nr:uncharacterized protein Bfra_002148 [Botrytis fragariae]KAF5877781.1 hypothetical protein Bfra_002148 [Botrytis fragariae]
MSIDYTIYMAIFRFTAIVASYNQRLLILFGLLFIIFTFGERLVRMADCKAVACSVIAIYTPPTCRQHQGIISLSIQSSKSRSNQRKQRIEY